jgi:ABC-2 type transport system permease protein
MTDNRIISIAGKEFFDHIRSRRFLLILGILSVIAVAGILNGITDYHTSVEAYNNLQRAVSHEWGATMTEDTYQKMKPSVLQVFYRMSTLFTIAGGVLGIAMGFDLITKEKESKSLKILLAHPVFRDQVINGKALGGIAAILLALGCVIAVSLGILLVSGIVPDISELLPILLFCAATFLFIFSYFTIALLMSAICEDSGRSLVYSLILFVILGSFIPAVANSPLVMDIVIGPAPDLPQIIPDPALKDQNREAWDMYDRQTQERGEKEMKVGDLRYLFSPQENYIRITTFLTSPVKTSEMLYPVMAKGWGYINETSKDISVGVMYEQVADFDFSQILTMIFGNLIALLILPLIFFGLAYVSFMRMDIR